MRIVAAQRMSDVAMDAKTWMLRFLNWLSVFWSQDVPSENLTVLVRSARPMIWSKIFHATQSQLDNDICSKAVESGWKASCRTAKNRLSWQSCRRREGICILKAPLLFLSMSEPLGVVASVVALLQLTQAVIQGLSSVRDALKERSTIRDEIIYVSGLLFNLKGQLTRNEIWSVIVSSLASPAGPLQQLTEAL